MNEATTILCHGLNELHTQIVALGDQGYRIVTVIDTQHGLYTIVAQKDDLTALGNVISNAIWDAMQEPR